MMDDAPLLTRDTPDAMLRALPGDGRRIDLRLLSWRDVAEHTEEGIRERFLPGAFAGTDPSRVTLESQNHRGAIVGRAETVEEREDAAYATFVVAPTPAGDELLTLARQGILRAASVVFRPSRRASTQAWSNVSEWSSRASRCSIGAPIHPRPSWPSVQPRRRPPP